MAKCYKFEFEAYIEKTTLGIKKEGLELACFWKRGTISNNTGDKISQTDRVKLENCTAYFNKKLNLQMTMNFNP